MIKLIRLLVKALKSTFFNQATDLEIRRASPSKHAVATYERKQQYGLRSNPQYRKVQVKQYRRGI